MKNVILFALMLACIASQGKCRKHKKNAKTTSANTQKIVVLNNTETWMKYNETKCANPWSFNWFAPPTDEQLAGAVKSHIVARGIPVLEIRTQRDKIVSCEACTCPNGFHYFVHINKRDIPKLTELKFELVEDVPEATTDQK